jgi:hypothetical protein
MNVTLAYKQGFETANLSLTPLCPYNRFYERGCWDDWYQGLYDGRKIING